MGQLSVVLATFNEERNLRECLESVKDPADEIVIVDGTSIDNTVAIAKQFKAKIIITDNPPIFHINKQKALDAATKEWILQLDADERVTSDLANEIKKVINLSSNELITYQETLPQKEMFLRHLRLLEQRDGNISKNDGKYEAFFIPRRNYFLGKYLLYGGVYPDGVIRLVKKGKAHFPCLSVHEQIKVDGKVGWLQNDLLHQDSPNFKKYINRWKRYIALFAEEFEMNKTGKDLFTCIKQLIVLPMYWFLLTYFRHKGFLDGWQGFVFSLFSSLRFPAAYILYLKKK